MAQIGDNQSYRDLTADARRAAQSGDEALEQVLKDMAGSRVRAADVARLDLDALSEAGRSNLQRAIAEQLKGQLPPNLAKALSEGKLGPDLMSRLLDRIVNINDPNAANKTPKADSPEAARQQAKDGSMPEFGLRWAQFVQKAQHIPGPIFKSSARIKNARRRPRGMFKASASSARPSGSAPARTS